MAEQKANDNNIPTFSLKDRNFVREITGQNEKVIFGAKCGDRRVHVPNPSLDNRIIMRCIGRLYSSYTTDNYSGGVGTGTVFDYHNGWAYVITCAHNVRKKNAYGNSVEPKILQFQREKWNGYNSYLHPYKNVKIAGVYNYKHKKRDFNDLAILKFKDDDGFYQKLFTENKGKIELFNSDHIDEHNEKKMKYNIYGYPVPKDVHAKQNGVQNGELWGMEAKYDNQEIELYIRKSDNKQLWNYNAIDTEGGQSGSAIFVKVGDDGYGIVGIHTGGSKPEYKNWGVTLNQDKYEWAVNTVKTDKEKNQNRNGNHANGYNNHHHNHVNHGYNQNANQGGQFNNGNRVNRHQMNNNNQNAYQRKPNNPQQSENIETMVNQFVEYGVDGNLAESVLKQNGCNFEAALEILLPKK